MILSLTMPFPIIAAIPAGIVAAMGKGVATIGGSIAGGVASYYIIDGVNDNDQPQISTAILSSASDNKSDSLLAVNFGGAESGLVIITIIIVAALVIYKCGATCRYRCCKKKQSSKKLEGLPLQTLLQPLAQPYTREPSPSKHRLAVRNLD